MKKKYWYLKGLGLLTRATPERDGSLSNPQIYDYSKRTWIRDGNYMLFQCLAGGFYDYCAEPVESDAEIRALKQIENLALRFTKNAYEKNIPEEGISHIEHNKAVASGLESPVEKAAAYMHDIVENTDITIADIIDVFGDEIARIVNLLTYDDECNYIDEYLWFIAHNPNAMKVKLADLECHLENEHLNSVPDEDHIRKLEGAIMFLKGYKQLHEELDY